MGQTGEFAAGPLIVRQAASMQALYTNVSHLMLERCFNHELFSKRRAMQEEPVQFMISDTATAFTLKYSV